MSLSNASREPISHAVSDVVAGLAAVTGPSFFRSLVVHLTRKLNVSSALVVECTESEDVGRGAPFLRTIALCVDGRICDDRELQYQKSPFDRVIVQGMHSFSAKAPSQFRGDAFLSELNAESFSGVCLRDSQDKAVGMLAITHTEPLEDLEFVESVLTYFSSRVAAELEQKRTEMALRQSEARHRALLESVPVCIHEIDAHGRLGSINPEGLRILGVADAADVIGRPFVDFVANWDRERVRRLLEQTFEGTQKEFEFTAMIGGGLRILSSSFVPLANANSGFRSLLGYSQDITERKQSEERLVYLAEHDHLTDLPNRGLFMDRLQSGIARAKRSGQPLALLYIDVNNFKSVNDRFGHHVGDWLLRVISRRLTQAVREVDTVARLGGDEFAVIVEAVASEQAAMRVARKIATGMGKPIVVEDRQVDAAVSVGLAMYPRDGDTPHALLRSSDEDMYRAKRSG